MSAYAHGHAHGRVRGRGHAGTGQADRRWLGAALAVVVVFMAVELVAGLLAHSLALIADAGHMLTDAAALLLALVASRLAERPARGAYTYGFARVDALSGQANGITLLLLALWFTVEGIGRLMHPAATHGAVVAVVAVVGAGVNLLATWLAGRADRGSLNIRGVLAHLITDVWAFAATFVAGIVVLWTGWLRADAVATLVVAALMAWTGAALVRASGRVFLEAAPHDVDPHTLGTELAAIRGVAEVHDLHVWVLGGADIALSAHVLVDPSYDCHEVSAQLRARLGADHGIGHVTLQVDHADRASPDSLHCDDAHGIVHVARADPH